MKMKKVRILAIMLLVMGILTSCKKSGLSEKKDGQVKVKIEAVKTITGNQNYYVGTVEETVSIPLSFMTTGMVEKVFVIEGQKVKKGQLLALLSTESAEDAYQIVLAKEKQAKDAYDRLVEVYNKGSLPEIKLIEVETALSQAQAAARIAKKNLEDCKITAPVDGYIGNRSIEPGTNVIPGNTVITVVKIDKVYTAISVPEKEIFNIQIGQQAEITVAALDGEKYTGEIVEKGVIANPISHTYNVKILLNNEGFKLMPGMVSQVFLKNDNTTSSLAIAPQAVQEMGNGQKFVFLASSNSTKVTRRMVQTGGIKEGGIVVTNGLQIGDSVVVEGYQKIDENTNILIIR
jgi:membrane fusion protein (multidrug efflux system)